MKDPTWITQLPALLSEEEEKEIGKDSLEHGKEGGDSGEEKASFP